MDQKKEKIILTIFTDPMMGLSYEMEPVFRKLETHFPDQIDIIPCMNVLVKDVYDFVDQSDLSKGREYALQNYLKKLADIYKSEEEISGMPIHMDGFRLFSKEYPSSFPLCLAYKAAELADRDRAGCFLYHLRYATVAECRPTTQLEEILAVVQRTGIDQKAFLQEYHGDRAEKALDEDRKLGRQLRIRSLPAYLIRYQDRAMLFQTFSYQDFVSMIEKISQGNIRPVSVSATEDTLRKLLTAHPLISPIEIREAFDLRDMDEVKQCLQPFLERQEIRIRNVAPGWFVERREPM